MAIVLKTRDPVISIGLRKGKGVLHADLEVLEICNDESESGDLKAINHLFWGKKMWKSKRHDSEPRNQDRITQ
jgi:hypothetical protein